ncbi:ArnT family glycosyltransferase [Tenacibaculum sp. MEBiC06402]|uniref:ArnT family glycosyltransferase n=1 Tax=unclassified Tenacibaculum TaxID=2635139 RepID=UPI003B9C9FC9
MKLTQHSRYFFLFFGIFLFLVNLIQGFTTELISDEAYYWTYSNKLDWGYFDHPPMVAIWISISKFFFAASELSVRFFSSITLPLNFFIVWNLIENPKKNEYKWLFVLLALTTSLFNVYGFITVPDTPLMFFTALFLLGYKKYLTEKSTLSYLILAFSMACMLYSKYQSVLVIAFALLSNLKVLKDGKIWLTALLTIALFSPHLIWQFENDFPSVKYHLFERKENTVYRFRDTYMHFINTIVIFGFTFPIIYKAFFKNLKNKDLFQKALNFIVIGFISFFFISTFKTHAQAQWIVPISIPLIIIPFNYLVANTEDIKLFKVLAIITLVVTTFLRFAMANDGILPKQFEMHGNKKWTLTLKEKLKDKSPLFYNSYQNTSIYWFYAGERPHQLNSWDSRKNQYDLYDFNEEFTISNAVLVGINKRKFPSDSLLKKNTGKIYLKHINNSFYKNSKLNVDFSDDLEIKESQKNTIKLEIQESQKNTIKSLKLAVALRFGKDKRVFPAELKNNTLEFDLPHFNNTFTPNKIQIIGTSNLEVSYTRLSPVKQIQFKNEK